jgi:hypothetical protein
VRRVFEVCVHDFHAHPIRLASHRRPRQNAASLPGAAEPALGSRVKGPFDRKLRRVTIPSRSGRSVLLPSRG